MTRIYFIRHGESTANAEGIFQGISDMPLTQRGLVQGEHLAKHFASIPLEAIYASPLIRAQKTAHLLASHHPGLAVVTDPALLEVSGGNLEGVPIAKLQTHFTEELDVWTNRPWVHVAPGATDGGVPGAYLRMQEVIARLVKQHPNQTVAIVAHGLILRIFNCIAKGLQLEQMNEIGWGENTCYTCVDFDEALTPTLIALNKCSHLPAELLTADLWGPPAAATNNNET